MVKIKVEPDSRTELTIIVPQNISTNTLFISNNLLIKAISHALYPVDT